MLALNTGNEISLDAIASKSAVSKNTLKRYTDRVAKQRGEWEPWIAFCRENSLRDLTVTTRTVDHRTEAGGIAIHFEPTAVHAYRLGEAMFSEA